MGAARCASRGYHLLQGHRLRGEDEVVGHFRRIREAVPGEQPLLPPGLGPAEV
jgi:hypothetical protein